jgi:hypothetical protein
VAENWSVKFENECIYRVNCPDKGPQIGQLNFGGRELVHCPFIIRHQPNCSLGFFIPSKKLEGELVQYFDAPFLFRGLLPRASRTICRTTANDNDFVHIKKVPFNTTVDILLPSHVNSISPLSFRPTALKLLITLATQGHAFMKINISVWRNK